MNWSASPRRKVCLYLKSPEGFLVLAFAVPLCVYLLTLAPGLTWSHYGADGGDLVTAAYTLGVPHPPGYPTYTLLAWLFTRLPLSNVAWRLNLLAAISTSAAAAMIYWTVVRLTLRAGKTRRDTDQATQSHVLIAALGAAWSYAFAPLVWSQALIAEVYAVAGLWTALVVGMVTFSADERETLTPTRVYGVEESAEVRRRANRDTESVAWPFILGLVWSLGLGVHLALIFLAPIIIWGVVHRSTSTIRPLSCAVLGFVVGLLVWLYLPLRAGRGGVTWGQPATAEGFWWLVSAALYRDYVFAVPASALSDRIAAWAHTWASGLGLIGVGLAALAIAWGAGRWWGWTIAAGLSFAAWNVIALGYNTADSVVYLVPAFVLGSMWLGVGLERLSQRMRRSGGGGRWLTPLMFAVALATPVWMLLRNGATLDLSGDRDAQRFCEAVKMEAPSDAILLSTTDRQTFALWYCQEAEGLRLDVAIVDEGLLGFEWYRLGLERTHPGLWRSSVHAGGVSVLTDERPHCRIHRDAQTRWLDCQSSKTD